MGNCVKDMPFDLHRYNQIITDIIHYNSEDETNKTNTPMTKPEKHENTRQEMNMLWNIS